MTVGSRCSGGELVPRSAAQVPSQLLGIAAAAGEPSGPCLDDLGRCLSCDALRLRVRTASANGFGQLLRVSVSSPERLVRRPRLARIRAGELVPGLHFEFAECFRRIDGIRVADASVMPSIVSGNTMATVYGIAERAVSLMQE